MFKTRQLRKLNMKGQRTNVPSNQPFIQRLCPFPDPPSLQVESSPRPNLTGRLVPGRSGNECERLPREVTRATVREKGPPTLDIKLSQLDRQASLETNL